MKRTSGTYGRWDVSRRFLWKVAAAIGVPLALGGVVIAAEEKKRGMADSRAVFPHRIVIMDENEIAITSKVDPGKPAQPYSPNKTCGKCHDVSAINTGWHFNARGNEQNGRPGEPWIYKDAATRTILPLSERGWKGTFKPAEAGVSDWDMVTHFGPHMPGGGIGTNPATQPVQKGALWALSGKLENDCMICHDAGNTYNTADRELQIKKQLNFKWAPTVAAGLGIVQGSVAQIAEDAEAEGEDPLKSKTRPKLTYDAGAFAPDNRVFFDVTRRSPNSKCYFCHTTNEVGDQAAPRWQQDRDVHLVSGIMCVDCHRHGIDHKVVRGYEGEAAERKDAHSASLTCFGCHYGNEPGAGGLAMGGRLGAPRPAHVGLPPIHLEKLSCTACHAGPWPTMQAGHVQTSLAHELGAESFGRTADEQPRLAAPVFLRERNADGSEGKIAPYKMVWPNYWGRLEGEKVKPVALGDVKAAGKGIIPVGKANTEAEWAPLSDEQIGKVLEKLTREGAAEPVYVSGGRLYRRSKDGKVGSTEHPAASAYAWPIAHDVRPASQSLGVRGCADCHSSQGAIFFAQVASLGPIDPKASVVKTNYELRDESGFIWRLFHFTFNFRTMLKVFVFGCAAVVAGVLLLYSLRALGWVTAIGSTRSDRM